MSDTLEGTVHGKTVELARDPGLEKGQRVEVVLRPVTAAQQPAVSAAGMLADVPDLDESLHEIEKRRKQAQNRTDSL